MARLAADRMLMVIAIERANRVRETYHRVERAVLTADDAEIALAHATRSLGAIRAAIHHVMVERDE